MFKSCFKCYYYSNKVRVKLDLNFLLNDTFYMSDNEAHYSADL